MSQTTTHLLLIYSAKQVVQIADDNSQILTGPRQNQPRILNEKIDVNGLKIGLSIVIDLKGHIEAVDYDDVIQCQYRFAIFERNLNAKGFCILPGLIDAHTHPIWAGERVDEFSLKLKGATYDQITKSGGGIHRTIEQTSKASNRDLFLTLRDRLFHMMKCGTTTVECKSGYGLDFKQELRLLKLLTIARNNLPLDLSITYLGAHAVPKNSNESDFTKQIIENDIPALKAELNKSCINQGMKNNLITSTSPHINGGGGGDFSAHKSRSPKKVAKPTLLIHNVDVFCEKSGYFNSENTYRILSHAYKELFGPTINFHGDELSNAESYKIIEKLRREIPACVDRFMAISHLEELDVTGISYLQKDGKCVAVLLPVTKLVLGIMDKNKPPARKLIDSGVPVALGTDFNPSTYCLSMPMVMYLSSTMMGLTMEEALVASTLNAAASLNLSHVYGSIEPKKFGDFIILNTDDWRNLIYQFGNTDHLIYAVIKKGRLVYRRNSPSKDHNPSNLDLWAAKQPQTGEMIFNETLTSPTTLTPFTFTGGRCSVTSTKLDNVISIPDELDDLLRSDETLTNTDDALEVPADAEMGDKGNLMMMVDDVILPPSSDWWAE